ncbi:unnamed protein product, partial [Iphiclides podalirius]
MYIHVTRHVRSLRAVVTSLMSFRSVDRNDAKSATLPGLTQLLRPRNTELFPAPPSICVRRGESAPWLATPVD